MAKYLFCLIIAGFLLMGCPASPPENTTESPESPRPMLGPAEEKPVVLESQLDAAMAKLRKELGEGFIFGQTKPFVIAGNIPEAELESIHDYTIKLCSEALYKDFFTQKPDYVLKVYLLKDAQTYEDYCEKTLGQKPSTPYGFYQYASRSLIMNIGTGTGTLVHEMVHALIKPDFPDVPAWFNEGLGSLYEQCRVESGSLRGLINWRYQGLMEAQRNNKLMPLNKLFGTSDTEFYGENSRIRYAQARYFCLYLQEHKVLPRFYKKFKESFDDDKTGIKAAEELLNKPIEEIDRDWQAWIRKVADIDSLR